MARWALRARYVFPVDRPPLPHGVVTIDGERIVAVGQNASGHPPIDLGGVALLPGLVNAHTHLEFSQLAAPLGRPGMPLPEWLAQVVALRRVDTAHQASTCDDAIWRGLRESMVCGVTTLGEIARPEWSAEPFENVPLGVTVFVELIGLTATHVERLMDLAGDHLRRVDASPDRNWHPGVSPHAPYSVNPDVVERVAQEAGEGPVAMHLAESREELEWLQTGQGPFTELLRSLGIEAGGTPHGSRPLDYLRRLSAARGSLVIHGNYLDREELEFLAAHRERMSLVYCPRTHAYFQHEPYPLASALALGVEVALGTDSRASNPDLSVLEEMRFVAHHDPSIAPEHIVRLGTIAGACALGRDAEVGTLTVGKLANLAAIEMPSNEGDPYELLLAGGGPCRTSWFRGRQVPNPAQPTCPTGPTD